MNVNHFFCIGNLTRDPELKSISDGKSVAKFGIALNERDKNNEEHTSFLEVECWNRLAEVVGEHLCKGRRVHVHGRLKQERWENDNGKRSRVIVVARNITFLDASTSFNPDDYEEKGKE